MSRSKYSAPGLAHAQIRVQNISNSFRSLWTRTLPAVAITGAFGLLAAVSPATAKAQEPNPTSQPAAVTDTNTNPIVEQNGIYIYRVKVVERNLDCVNYLHRSDSTRIGFEGTTLLPGAKGEAKVTSERGKITIDAHFDGLTPANGFGREYLTYVLWAISPDGRAQNLGEVLPAGTKNNLKVTTALQSFGLIITAEPYFSVTEPSDVVVLQNEIRPDKTNGVMEKVEANYSLLPRGMYAETAGSHTVANPITRNERSPLELYEADNAVRIAQDAGADKYAPQIMAQATLDVQQASALDGSKHGDRKMEITEAREAVERAEDARITSLRKQAAERAQAQVAAKEQAQADAAQSQQQAAQAQVQAAQSQVVAQQAKLDAEQAQAAKAQADAARAQAEAETAAAQARAVEANKSANDANAIREKLRAQLNLVLATSESARGLIVNMSGVLFETGKSDLRPEAREKLAKISGIVLAHPGLKLEVEGHTDSVGSDSSNQILSEHRAQGARDYLVHQGIAADSIVSRGLGSTMPIGSNDTVDGRQSNRRVELIVSGDSIRVPAKAQAE